MKLSIKGVMSNVQILFFTLRKGKIIGVDDYGNKYYRANPRKGTKLERRWVIYKADINASNVPAEWHGWLHHQTNYIPEKSSKKTPYRQKHQAKHTPNQTGTENAYFPSRDKATGDYNAWTPPK